MKRHLFYLKSSKKPMWDIYPPFLGFSDSSLMRFKLFRFDLSYTNYILSSFKDQNENVLWIDWYNMLFWSTMSPILVSIQLRKYRKLIEGARTTFHFFKYNIFSRNCATMCFCKAQYKLQLSLAGHFTESFKFEP